MYNTLENIATSTSIDKVVDYVIVSDSYWPQSITTAHDNTIQFKHHPVANHILDLYKDTFLVVKKPRKLEVVANSGLVTIQLDFDDNTTREFNVTPLQVRYLNKISHTNVITFICIY